MNTQGKIDLALDPARLCLHREGVFYKLYNLHAMLFTQNIKPLKIKVKFIKTVGQHVYSAGFPASLLDTVTKQMCFHGGVLEEIDNMVTVSSLSWEKQSDYRQWCVEQIPEAAGGGQNNCSYPTALEQRIAGFQIMHKTPLEAMNFVIELQEMLNSSNE